MLTQPSWSAHSAISSAAAYRSAGVVPAYGGEALAQQMGIYQEVADEFGG